MPFPQASERALDCAMMTVQTQMEAGEITMGTTMEATTVVSVRHTMRYIMSDANSPCLIPIQICLQIYPLHFRCRALHERSSLCQIVSHICICEDVLPLCMQTSIDLSSKVYYCKHRVLGERLTCAVRPACTFQCVHSDLGLSL